MKILVKTSSSPFTFHPKVYNRYIGIYHKWSASMVNTDRQIVEWTAAGGGLNQLKSSCHQKVQARAFFAKSYGVKHSVLLRHNVLKKVFQIYNTEINDKQHLDFERTTNR